MIEADKKKLERDVEYLLSLADSNHVHTVALVATEMHFRTSVDRLLEFAAYPILYCCFRQQLLHMSVGISQIQVQHWVDLGFIRSARPSLRNMLVFFDPRLNLLACEAYIAQHAIGHNPFDLLSSYTGKVTTHQLSIYIHALNFSKNLCERTKICLD